MADLSKCNPLQCPRYAQCWCEYCFELDLLLPLRTDEQQHLARFVKPGEEGAHENAG